MKEKLHQIMDNLIGQFPLKDKGSRQYRRFLTSLSVYKGFDKRLQPFKRRLSLIPKKRSLWLVDKWIDKNMDSQPLSLLEQYECFHKRQIRGMNLRERGIAMRKLKEISNGSYLFPSSLERRVGFKKKTIEQPTDTTIQRKEERLFQIDRSGL